MRLWVLPLGIKPWEELGASRLVFSKLLDMPFAHLLDRKEKLIRFELNCWLAWVVTLLTTDMETQLNEFLSAIVVIEIDFQI